MSTFYLLPPRPLLAERLAAHLDVFFPGLAWDDPARTDLIDGLLAAVGRHADVYVVGREELADATDPAAALREGHGAEPADQVVEVRLGLRPGEVAVRRWRLGDAD